MLSRRAQLDLVEAGSPPPQATSPAATAVDRHHATGSTISISAAMMGAFHLRSPRYGDNAYSIGFCDAPAGARRHQRHSCVHSFFRPCLELSSASPAPVRTWRFRATLRPCPSGTPPEGLKGSPHLAVNDVSRLCWSRPTRSRARTFARSYGGAGNRYPATHMPSFIGGTGLYLRYRCRSHQMSPAPGPMRSGAAPLANMPACHCRYAHPPVVHAPILVSPRMRIPASPTLTCLTTVCRNPSRLVYRSPTAGALPSASRSAMPTTNFTRLG